MKNSANLKLRYLPNLQKSFRQLEQAVKSLGDAHFYAADQHQQIGAHALLDRAISLRNDLSSLVEVARNQEQYAKSQEPKAGSL